MAERRTSIVLYRSLLRAARAVQKNEKKYLIFTAAQVELRNLETYQLNTNQDFKWKSYGLSGIVGGQNVTDNNEHSLLYGTDIEKLVKLNFTAARHDESGEHAENRIDLGFKALSCVSLLKMQSARSSVHISNKDPARVRIILTTYLHEQQPSTKAFNFHYRVQVENIGQGNVQLFGRHWVFRNSRGEEESGVSKYAHGVVGATPIIPPGAAVQYMSQCFLSTECGDMEGNFLMKDLDKEELFLAEIARYAT